jgi:hypothetical protein
MLEFLAQAAIVAGLYTWVWLMPDLLLGAPGRRRMYRRLLRAVLRGVKAALTWPGRSYARRQAAATALRIQLREQDPRYRELMIGTDMEVTAVHPEGFEPGIRPPEPQPSIFGDEILVRRDGRGVQVAHTAGLPEGFVPPSGALFTQAPPSTWSPAVAAAMPTARCNSCPEFGCHAKGADPECEFRAHPYRPGCSCERCASVVDYDEVTAHEQNKPVAYVPTWHRGDDVLRALAGAQLGPDASVVLPSGETLDRDALRLRLAMMQARLPQLGDDRIADPPRDVFDAQKPTYPCGRFEPHAEHDCGEHFEVHCPGGLPDPLYPPTGGRLAIGPSGKRVRPPEERLAASLNRKARPWWRKRPSGARRRRGKVEDRATLPRPATASPPPADPGRSFRR